MIQSHNTHTHTHPRRTQQRAAKYNGHLDARERRVGKAVAASDALRARFRVDLCAAFQGGPEKLPLRTANVCDCSASERSWHTRTTNGCVHDRD
jgi:hypothetical protein